MKTINYQIQQSRDLIERGKRKLAVCFSSVMAIRARTISQNSIQGDRDSTGYIGFNTRDFFKLIIDVILIGLAILADKILSVKGIEILFEKTGYVEIAKTALPVLVNILEIIVAYQAKLLIRDGIWSERRGNIIKYLVCILYAAFTVVSLGYVFVSYSPTIDPGFLLYALPQFIGQILLFIFSMFLHVTIIEHSENIIMGFYGLYRSIKERKKVHRNNEILRLGREEYTKFTSAAGELDKFMTRHRERFPEDDYEFSIGLAADVKDAANKVMGRNIFNTTL
jgi:hypothetical protein